MAAPLKIDFFGFYVDRAAVSTHLTAAVAAAKTGVNAEPDLLDRVDDVILGGGRLRGLLGDIADGFGSALSATAPGLSEGVASEAITDDPVRRIPLGLSSFNLGSLAHLFDRRPLVVPLSNLINRLELRLMKGLADLGNLNWGFAEGSAALQKRLQQMRVYFVDYTNGRFRDRNGTALIAPGGTIDPFHLSPALVGQLIHVLLEFTGDAAYQVPVRTPTDGTAVGALTCVRAAVIAAAIAGIHLNGDATQADFSGLVAEVVRYAGKHAESATRAQVGALVRGGGLAGINNEAIAEAIASSLGGLVKKSAEKVAFETLKAYITANAGVDVALRDFVLAVLTYLHLDGPKPAGFLA